MRKRERDKKSLLWLKSTKHVRSTDNNKNNSDSIFPDEVYSDTLGPTSRTKTEHDMMKKA